MLLDSIKVVGPFFVAFHFSNNSAGVIYITFIRGIYWWHVRQCKYYAEDWYFQNLEDCSHIPTWQTNCQKRQWDVGSFCGLAIDLVYLIQFVSFCRVDYFGTIWKVHWNAPPVRSNMRLTWNEAAGSSPSHRLTRFGWNSCQDASRMSGWIYSPSEILSPS